MLVFALLLGAVGWWIFSANSAPPRDDEASPSGMTPSAPGQGSRNSPAGEPLPAAAVSPGGSGGPATNAPVILQWGRVETTAPAWQAASRQLRASSNPAPVQRLSQRGTVPWLVQFNDVIREEWKAAMQNTGATIKGYIPENTFLVEATPSQISAIGRMAPVQWLGEYVPEYKKTAQVQRAAAGATTGPEEYNVIVFEPGDAETVAAKLAGLAGVQIAQAGPMADRGMIRAKLTPDALREVATFGEVEWIEPHLTPQLWNNVAAGSSRMDVSRVWSELGLTGSGQTVAVLDSGLDTGNTSTIHPDFTGRVTGFGWASGNYNVTNSWADTDGHGTHVAGSVLGSGAASTNTFRGIAYQANLIVQGAQANLSGIAVDWRPILAQAFTNGARVHNNSWGYNDYGAYHSSSRNLDMYMWTNRTMVVVVAAGNSGIDANSNGVVDPTSIGSPASAKNCIAVGAAENFRTSGGAAARTWGSAFPASFPANPIKDDFISRPETPQGMAGFSSRGPLLDGRIKPDIVAPGTDIISTKSRQSSDTAWGSHPNTNYMYSGGTSMASPLVAGAAALTRQWLIQSNGFTNPSAALVKAVLLNGARNMAPGQYGTGATQEIPAQRPNNVTGWGHVDLYDSLVALTNAVRHLHDSGTLATGQTNTFTYPVGTATTNRFVITMAYTDYFPAIGAGRQLVNDLDLTVIKPSGATVFANGGDGLDSTNNVETVEFTPDEIGDYTVRVHARTVPQGSTQPYSLVVVAPLTAAPVITSASTASGTIGQSFSYQITADNSPTSYGASGLPPGLSVNTSTGLISGAPTSGGTYNATVTATNAVGTGQAALTITIAKLTATVTLGNLSAVYDGAAKTASVTTTPPGLPVTLTYDGSATLPVNAGSYAVVATVNDSNYTGNASGTLVIAKATATVSLGDLNQTYDGSPKPVSVSTVPSSLSVDVSYDGSPTAPTAVGSYAVTALVSEANYAGSASGTLVIHEGVLTFAQWIANFPGLGNTAAGGDPDGDGLINAMEYFMALDPATKDAAGAMVPDVAGSSARLDYRRSKALNGLSGAVKWSTNPGNAAAWSTNLLSDTLLHDHGTWEFRRASVPWTNGDQIFLRLDLHVD